MQAQINRKEQARTENLARRNFQKKWAKLADEKLNRFYNQNEVNRQLNDVLRSKGWKTFG